MNFIRSRLSLYSLLGQRRQVTQIWSRRGMCDKPQKPKAASSPATPAQELHPPFRVSVVRLSNMDKKTLIWSGRFKSADKIPEVVSQGMIDAARDRIRIKVGSMLVAATFIACAVLIYMGKKARSESLAALNLNRKGKLEEELRKII